MIAKDYRNLIGRFATGVTVVTTEHQGKIHGMTANAVTSVSLEPILLLVCVDHGTQCHQQMIASDRFGLSILKAGQEELSNLFAARGEPEKDRLRGVPYTRTDNGIVLLDDCLARFECLLHGRIPCGDHDLCVGKVVAGEMIDDAEPLVFFGGSYRQLTPAD